MDEQKEIELETFLYQYITHEKIGLTNSLTELLKNTIYEVSQFLNSGSFSKCYECIDRRFIVKTNIDSNRSEEDGTIFFINHCVKNEDYVLPKIYYHWTHGYYYFVIMERLSEIPDNEQNMYLDILVHRLNKIDYNKSLRDQIKSQINSHNMIMNSPLYMNFMSSVHDIAYHIKKSLNTELELDCSLNNFLLRQNQIILVDPFRMKKRYG